MNELRKAMKRDDFVGFIISPSVIGASTEADFIDAKLINESLEKKGFDKNYFMPLVKPSSCYLDTVREWHNKKHGNLRKTNRIYRFEKTFHDTTNAGRITHVVLRIQSKGARINDEETLQVAEINFYYGGEYAQKHGDGAYDYRFTTDHESEVAFLEDFKQALETRLNERYDSSRLSKLIIEACTGQFNAVRLRPSGGIYMLTKENAELYLDYKEVIESCTSFANMLTIPSFANDLKESGIQASLVESFVLDFQALNNSWQKKIEDAAVFRHSTVVEQIIKIKKMKEQAKRLSDTLGFQLDQIDAISSVLDDTMKEAAQNIKR